jgi:DeoR family transcriptional regulator, ulaG and ulaABCDEF operon transcriptional repressor
MQTDVILLKAEQRLISRSDKLILRVDSSKFRAPEAEVVCDLKTIDTIITDTNISETDARLIKRAGIELIVATK